MSSVAVTLNARGPANVFAKRARNEEAPPAKKRTYQLLEGEAEIATRARQGDHKAFEALVQAYHGTIYNLAYHMCYDTTAALDLTQEVFLRLHENFRLFDPNRPFRPWFLRLATNTMINKRPRKRGIVSLDVGEDSSMASNIPDPGAEEAHEQALRVEMGGFVRKAIELLPDRYRAIVTLRYIEGLSYEELAETLGLPMGTVKVRLFRARDRLKDLLANYYYTEDAKQQLSERDQ